MLWAGIVLPSLAMDGALRRRPGLVQAFALVHGVEQRRRLVAVNAAARAQGLRPGQRLAEAGALCPKLQTAPYNPRHRQHDLEWIAAWAYGYSADVLLDPPAAVALEVSRSMRLFGPWPHFEARLRAGLEELGFHHRIALAPNPCAARVLARNRDGATANAAALPDALQDIPVARAGLSTQAATALPGVGIHTLGPLLRLPRAALARRFGQATLHALDTLTGQRPSNLERYTPPAQFKARIEFNSEIHNTQSLLFPLRRLLSDLAAFAAARDAGVQHFSLAFIHAHAPATELRIGLLAVERQATALFDITQLRLERLQLRQPVLELQLCADELPGFVPPGQDLFDTRTANALPWPQLVERLRARLGEMAVHGLAADPDPRPERASPQTSPQIPQSSSSACPPLPLRPAWLLPQPSPLQRPPARILSGPERLESGWWDGADTRRDYYIVELPGGQRAWAFCPPGQRGPFMLHGWFA